ncbi:unnamed protein product [Adineta steineri]|uniref:Uncharacterized protein n=1 Tax=Adineta steineri TaxID=433720 RepID=A0A814XP98_9BILA|nr:unnamed protein product [Adineta steineri]CAF3632160.1 unnamed protein product [Adineta steineri]
MIKKSYVNSLTQQTIEIPKFICNMIEYILLRLISHISLEQLSILRCCLPNFLYQLFQQIPNLTEQNAIDWIVEGIQTYKIINIH